MADKKIPMICVVGPTASGKTALSIELAKRFNGEIVSADSMQIYKGMDIATAKPSLEEQDGVVHHLMDFWDVDKSFSVAQYCELAKATILDINNRGKLPVLVGGTGLYVDSLIDNRTFVDVDSDEALRDALQKEYEQLGVEHLLSKLREFDPVSAQALEETRNPKRIIRAIEVYETTGITMSQHNANSRLNDSPYEVVKIGLTANNRQFLYDRVNRRVDIMVENGLVEEAKTFLTMNLNSTSTMAIGHKELIPYFNHEVELDTCLENLKMQTRRYAKRQLTWFRKDENINWLYIDALSKEELVDNAEKLVKKVLFNETC